MTTTLTAWDRISHALKAGENTLSYGPPGTGKTRIGHEFAKEIGKQVFVLNMTAETASAEMRGFYIPIEDRFEWMYGVVAQAMKVGGLLIINELNHAGPDAESFMHFACDDKGIAKLTLPNKEMETLYPADGYQVYATMNGLPEDLGEALADRFPIKVLVEENNPAAIAALSQDLQSFASGKRSMTSKNQAAGQLRSLFAFDRIRKVSGDQIAAELVFAHEATEFMNAIRLAS